jgi:hypothetical protein
VCLYTISRLCVFQAVLLLAQYYTMHLTTVITAPMRQCHKRTLFVATDMLCLLQAVLLLAQHYTMHLTTVITAPMRQCHKRTLFVAKDMLIFSVSKSSQNEVYCCTISRLCLFQAVLLLAQHYTMHLTTVITAPMRQCHKRTLFVATDMPVFGALTGSKNGVCLYTISRLCLI